MTTAQRLVILGVFMALPTLALAQMPGLPQSCEDKLNTSDKLALVLRDDLQRWQSQFITVWQRAEKAEAEVARLQEEVRKAGAEKPAPTNGKGTN